MNSSCQRGIKVENYSDLTASPFSMLKLYMQYEPTFCPSVNPTRRPKVSSISRTPTSSLLDRPALSGIAAGLAPLAIPVQPAKTVHWAALFFWLADARTPDSLNCSSTMTSWTVCQEYFKHYFVKIYFGNLQRLSYSGQQLRPEEG